MGLDVNAIRFLLDARQRGASFERVATIGRQSLCIDAETLHATVDSYGISLSRRDADSILKDADGFCEPFFLHLGASEVCSIDASAYQHATCIHDMNHPIRDSLKERFNAVIDGGTLEHIFNFPQAIANCMEMLLVGGHYLASTPSNNFMGHGFYQFSPELFYRVFSRANGFVAERMIIYQECWPFVWHDVLDPEQVRQRVTLVNRFPTYLLVESRRVEIVAPFARAPQQSDYVSLWRGTGPTAEAQSTSTNRTPNGHSAMRVGQVGARLGRFIPEGFKSRYRRLRQGKNPFDPRFFRTVDRRRAG
jgi:hypothetical protein